MSIGSDRENLWWNLHRFAERARENASGFPPPQSPFPLGPLHGAHNHPLWRVERVREALRMSGPMALSIARQKLAGLDLSLIWDILIQACQDIALYLGGSMLVGGMLGGIGGAFLGGAGALPGAIAGTAVGAEAGGWILAFLGLKALAGELLESIPLALHCYERGFREAWKLPDPGLFHTPSILSQQAAWEMAQGHVVLIVALLSATVAILSRGRGDRGALLQEIHQSPRLGPKMAQWVEENEERLLNHPSLQSNRRRGKTPVPGEDTPSPHEPGPEQPGKPVTMARKRVRCFEPNDLPQAKIPEFDRQLAGQENGLNTMTVQEYLDGRDAYATARDPAVARAAREEYQEKLVNDARDQLRDNGLPSAEAKVQAEQIAAEKMKTLAALHNPDLVAGGKDVIADFGDRNVNARIGAQWRGRVGDLDEAALAVPESDRTRVKMNAVLERCK